jgi:hypothetical protein
MDAPERRVKGSDAAKTLQRNNDAARDRNRPAGISGTATARDDRYIMLVAPRDSRPYSFNSGRHDDRVGVASQSARLRFIAEVRDARSGQDFVLTQKLPKLPHHR